MKNKRTLTKAMYHKGFSGYSSVVARSKLHVGGQVTTPQSLTVHSLIRYQQGEEKTTEYKLETKY